MNAGSENRDVDDQWEDMNDKCLLCDEPMETGKTILCKERAIETFIKASKRTKDNRDKKLEGLKQASFYKTCTVSYPRERDIKTAEKKRKEEARNSAQNRQRNQEARVFNFFMYFFFVIKLFMNIWITVAV